MNRLRHLIGFWAIVACIVLALGTLGHTVIVTQLIGGTLPTSQMLLERMTLALWACGALWILTGALRSHLTHSQFTSGLGMMLLSAVLGAVVAQPAPEPFLFVGVLLLFAAELQPTAPRARWARTLAWLIVWAVAALLLLTLALTFAQEGMNWYLPDSPSGYRLFAS